MKKETTIITTVEFTEILPNCFESSIGIEELKQQLKQRAKAKFEGMGFDNINITNVQVFELEKEEHISTEDLINTAKMCAIGDGRYCSTCPCNNGDIDCSMLLMGAIADRLEELYQQTEKLKKLKQYVPITCSTCNHENCEDCDHRLDGWQIGEI